MPTNKSKYNPAFTLAEVLVTLAIIGVVASLTIPSLMKNYQETVWKIAWKREFSILSQTMKMAVADNDGSIIGAFSTHNTLRNVLTNNLKTIKTCDTNTAYNICWSNPTYFLYGAAGGGNATNDMSSAALTNGATLKVVYRSSDCTSGSIISNNCGLVQIDVNGLKAPNTIGKDIYMLAILRDKIVPVGIDPAGSVTSPATTCIEGSTATTNTGYGCAAKYLYN